MRTSEERFHQKVRKEGKALDAKISYIDILVETEGGQALQPWPVILPSSYVAQLIMEKRLYCFSCVILHCLAIAKQSLKQI